MSTIKEHPAWVIIGGFAAIITILYTCFVFLTGKTSIANEASTKTKEESQLFKDTSIGVEESVEPRETQKIQNDSEQLKSDKQENNVLCDLNNITFRNDFNFLKIYNQAGNKFDFIGKILIDDLNGSGKLIENVIYLKGNFGNGKLTISKECNNITGYLKGKYETHSIDYYY